MLKKDYPDIYKLWNHERNSDDGLTFDEITPGSGRKVWWRCEHGHEWQAIVCNVVSKKSGCPYCSGLKAIRGENDLATINPELAKEWNADKNGDLKPEDYTPGSGKKVWWKCKKGHEWEAVISSRNSGVGCPYCAGRKVLEGFNDLATTNPDILSEWNYDKNTLNPSEVSFGSEKKVWWRCKHGHEWQAMVGDRVRGRGCPICSHRQILHGKNTIDATSPSIAKMWNYERNGDLKPSDVVSGSGKLIWWKCENGHEWRAAPYNIVKGQGCPICSNRTVVKGFNDLETLNPELAAEWNYAKNGNLKPSDIIAGSTKSVWWKCKKGHEWQARVYSRNQNHSCPFCNAYKVTSIPEKSIVYYLRKAGITVEENKKIAGAKEVDIYIPSTNTAIEYDGQYWHKDKRRDNDKNEICRKIGIRLIRIREPNMPTLNGYSKDYTIDKLTTDYSYMNPVIAWVLTQFNIKNHDIDIIRDIQHIQKLFDNYSIDSINTIPELANEWDYNKNIVSIDSVSKWSKMKAWWKCSKCGYSYECIVANKYNGAKCPKCANTKLISGHNDLATTRKDLLKMWNYEKNDIPPSSIRAGSNRKVWWKCKKGHEWQATPHNISKGQGCPYCAGKKVVHEENDLTA